MLKGLFVVNITFNVLSKMNWLQLEILTLFKQIKMKIKLFIETKSRKNYKVIENLFHVTSLH